MTKRAGKLHHDNAPAYATALVQACLAKRNITQVCQPPLQPILGSLRLLAFLEAKNTVEREEEIHTVHKLSQRRLSAD